MENREIKFRIRDPKTGKVIMYIDMSQNPMTWAHKMHEEYLWEQFTGTKDKNGSEIYEGDILKDTHWEGTPVSVMEFGDFDSEDGVVKAFRLVDRKYKEQVCTSESRYLEVIGNIAENPELLK